LKKLKKKKMATKPDISHVIGDPEASIHTNVFDSEFRFTHFNLQPGRAVEFVQHMNMALPSQHQRFVEVHQSMQDGDLIFLEGVFGATNGYHKYNVQRFRATWRSKVNVFCPTGYSWFLTAFDVLAPPLAPPPAMPTYVAPKPTAQLHEAPPSAFGAHLLQPGPQAHPAPMHHLDVPGPRPFVTGAPNPGIHPPTAAFPGGVGGSVPMEASPAGSENVQMAAAPMANEIVSFGQAAMATQPTANAPLPQYMPNLGLRVQIPVAGPPAPMVTSPLVISDKPEEVIKSWKITPRPAKEKQSVTSSLDGPPSDGEESANENMDPNSTNREPGSPCDLECDEINQDAGGRTTLFDLLEELSSPSALGEDSAPPPPTPIQPFGPASLAQQCRVQAHGWNQVPHPGHGHGWGQWNPSLMHGPILRV